MDLVLLLPALIQKRQLEKRPDVGPLARQRDEQRHVRGAVLQAFPVGVEVDGPVITAHRERVRRRVLADAHPLEQRKTGDPKVVGAVHRVGDGRRRRLRRRLIRRRGVGRRRGGRPGGGASSVYPAATHLEGLRTTGSAAPIDLGFRRKRNCRGRQNQLKPNGPRVLLWEIGGLRSHEIRVRIDDG